MVNLTKFWWCRHKYHERVAPNLEDTVVLLSRSLDLRVTGDEELALESVGSFQVVRSSHLPVNMVLS